jgi:hypothetical protein
MKAIFSAVSAEGPLGNDGSQAAVNCLTKRVYMTNIIERSIVLMVKKAPKNKKIAVDKRIWIVEGGMISSKAFDLQHTVLSSNGDNGSAIFCLDIYLFRPFPRPLRLPGDFARSPG